MFKTTAVIGATGMLGLPVAKALAHKGYTVRIISRDSSKARKLFQGSQENKKSRCIICDGFLNFSLGIKLF